jgi:hypothetical protein
MSKMAIEKNRRFVIFRVTFLPILSENAPIRIYRKTGPTKSTVLGPRPPPWRKHKFYRILAIFHDIGVYNTAGKSVSKIGIYALPPLKSEFLAFLLNLSLPNCSDNNLLPITELLATLFWSLVLYFPLPFFGTQSTLLL